MVLNSSADIEPPRSAGDIVRKELQLTPRTHILFIFAVWIATQFVGIFHPPLLDDMDALHVEAVREMLQRHDYVTLYVNGIRYLDKPPLPYWLSAASAAIFGVHDWAIRLPLALSVLALSLYLYVFGSRLFGRRAGFYSACVFSVCIGPYIFTRFFIPDVMLALWITIAVDLISRMLAWIKSSGRASKTDACAFALTLTLALLTKGLVGVVFPFGILFSYLLITRNLAALLRMRLALVAIVTLTTALPWHTMAAVRNPPSGEAKGWFWFYFINDQINRYLNKRIPRDYDKVPLLIFWGLLLVWLMPWGVYLLGYLRQRWRERGRETSASPHTLLITWALFILIFFSFSTRQEYYTLPAVPVLSLMIGYFLSVEAQGDVIAVRWGRFSSGLLFVIGLFVSVVCAGFASVAEPPPGAELYQVLTQDPSHYALSFGHIFDLTTASLGFFRAPLVTVAVSLFLGTALSLWLRLRQRYTAANVALTLGMVGVLSAVHTAYSVFYPILGSQPLAAAINHEWRQGDRIVFDGEYSTFSSVGFYTGQPVLLLNGRVNNLWYGSLFTDAPHRFEDDQSFAKLWNGAGRIFLLTDHPNRVQHFGGNDKIVVQSSGKTLLLNHR